MKTALQYSLRFVRNTLLFAAVFTGVFFISEWILSHCPVNQNEVKSGEVEIFVLSNGLHSDLVFPIDNADMNWLNFFSYSHTQSKDTGFKYVAVGWGDRAFYLETPEWDDVKFSTVFKATIGISKAAIHATFYKSMQTGKRCKSIHLNHTQYRKLVMYVLSYLELNQKQTRPLIFPKGYGKNEAFYAAHGTYSMFYSCNTWVNNALKTCGQKACIWTIFDSGILNQYP